jgi:hypothetical protein
LELLAPSCGAGSDAIPPPTIERKQTAVGKQFFEKLLRVPEEN